MGSVHPRGLTSPMLHGGNIVTASAGVDSKVIAKTGMNDEHRSLRISFFSCSICCGTVHISSYSVYLHSVSLLFSLFNPSVCIFYFFPSHHLLSFSPPRRCREMAHCAEQTVCVWDISCWFSGTLAWWMTSCRKLNNSWFASRETSVWDWTTFGSLISYVPHLMTTCTALFGRRWNLESLRFQIERYQSTSTHFILGFLCEIHLTKYR